MSLPSLRTKFMEELTLAVLEKGTHVSFPEAQQTLVRVAEDLYGDAEAAAKHPEVMDFARRHKRQTYVRQRGFRVQKVAHGARTGLAPGRRLLASVLKGARWSHKKRVASFRQRTDTSTPEGDAI